MQQWRNPALHQRETGGGSSSAHQNMLIFSPNLRRGMRNVKSERGKKCPDYAQEKMPWLCSGKNALTMLRKKCPDYAQGKMPWLCLGKNALTMLRKKWPDYAQEKMQRGEWLEKQ